MPSDSASSLTPAAPQSDLPAQPQVVARDKYWPFDDQPPRSRVEDRVATLSAFFRDAIQYRPDEGLREALWAGWALQRPVLLRGKPGCGKSTAAYWAARKIMDAFEGEGATSHMIQHVQIRSTTTAQELKYEFDYLRRLRDAQLRKSDGSAATSLNAKRYLKPGALWHAFDPYSQEQRYVVLLDEIDKAARDLPNDLLYELDKFEFEVPELSLANWETGEQDENSPGLANPPQIRVGVDRIDGLQGYALGKKRWERKQNLFVITSNDERTLPPPFLRRCLPYEIVLSEDAINGIIKSRVSDLPLGIKLLTEISSLLAANRMSPTDTMPLTNRMDWLRLMAAAFSANPRARAGAEALLAEPLTLGALIQVEHVGVLVGTPLLKKLRERVELSPAGTEPP